MHRPVRPPRLTYYLSARISERTVVVRQRATSEASARGIVAHHLTETRGITISPSELQLENITE